MDQLNPIEIQLLTDQTRRNARIERNRRLGVVTKAEIELIWKTEGTMGRDMTEAEVRSLLGRPNAWCS